MKIISVLAILSTLYCHSQAVLKCQKSTDWTTNAADPGLTEVTCDEGVTTCTRPIWKGSAYEVVDGGNALAVIWDCGVCATLTSCVSCTEENCNVPFECNTKDDATTQEKCVDKAGVDDQTFVAETTCVRPKVTDAAGTYSSDNVKWGCPPCTTEANCEVCTGPKCNVAPQSYTCLKYAKDEDSKWAHTAGQKDTCFKIEVGAVAAGCKMPTPDAAGAAPYASCGSVCADATCKACAEADCNDIASTRYCKDGVAGTVEGSVAALPSKFCATATTKCARPAVAYEAVVAGGEAYACADCVDAAKCKNCETSDCNNAWPTVNHKCYTWTWTDPKWVESADSSDCNAGDGEAKCNMPKNMAAQAGYTKSGCGLCGGEAGCTETAAGENRVATHKCYTWAWNTADSDGQWSFASDLADCFAEDASLKCNMPKDRSKNAGYTTTGCNKCLLAESAGCTETEAEKNMVDKTHQCYKWAWNTDDKKWKESAALADCYAVGTDLKCNLPKDRSKEKGYTSSGCGACKAAETAGCEATAAEKNVGQKAVISLLATLLSLLYVML